MDHHIQIFSYLITMLWNFKTLGLYFHAKYKAVSRIPIPGFTSLAVLNTNFDALPFQFPWLQNLSKFAPKHLPKCQVLCVFHLLYTYSKDVIFALKSEVLSIQCKTDRREAPNFRTINSILRRKNHNAYLSIDLK